MANQVINNNELKSGGMPKFTFKQWISHPTTILLIIVTTALWGIGALYFNSQLREVTYLKKRIEVLEKREEKTNQEMQAYIRALMFKETQLKEQRIAIDSLKIPEQ